MADLVQLKGWPKEVVITCIYKDTIKAFLPPNGQTTVAKRDRLFLCGKRGDIMRAARTIKKH